MTLDAPLAPSACSGERCCPVGRCTFSVENVRRFLALIRQLRRLDLDVSANARSVLNPHAGYERSRGAGSPYDETRPALILADVQRAVRSARAALSAEEIARALCPYADEPSRVDA